MLLKDVTGMSKAFAFHPSELRRLKGKDLTVELELTRDLML